MARTNTLADALALVVINGGRFHFCQPHVRNQMYDLYEWTDAEAIMKGGSWIALTAEGEELLKTSPLWAAHQRLLGMGYKLEIGRDLIRPRKYSKRYIAYTQWDEAQNREQSAWISATRRQPAIFISRRQSEGGSYLLDAELTVS